MKNRHYTNHPGQQYRPGRFVSDNACYRQRGKQIDSESRYTGRQMKRAAKITKIILIAVSVACFGFGLSFHYRNFPRSPQPEQGRTYSLNNHGVYSYLTKQEYNQQTVSFCLSAILCFIAVLIHRYADRFDGRKMKEWQDLINQPSSHKWKP